MATQVLKAPYPGLTNLTILIDEAAAPIAPPDDRQVILDKALAYVNVARTALDRPVLEQLPRGRRRNASECVIALALGAYKVGGGYVVFPSYEEAKKVAAVWATSFVPGGSYAAVSCPAALEQFVCYFDQGAYPELVARWGFR